MIFATITWLTLLGIFMIWLWAFLIMAFIPLWLAISPLRYFWDGIKGLIEQVK